MLTNNVISNIMVESTSKVVPIVGMGITECHYTDREAGTINRVSKSGKTFWYTVDDAERTDKNGMSESQDYTYTPNHDRYPNRATLRKDGVFRSTGTNYPIILGRRNKFYDYSF